MKWPCLHGNCPGVAVYRGRCEKHRKDSEFGRGNSYQRGYDGHWRKRRAEFLATHRQCFWCGGPATMADHIVPMRDCLRAHWTVERMHADENLRPACKPCHSRRTALDSSHWGKR